ncbi:NADP-dependent oxidoreductase [Streptomyces nigrescens]|uniref:NADP-dependent oxidoreductase n=1 Tax=Streptomyces nigrescens TaxID=1920 RepID=A0A640TVK9_STRNI|nr:NADP-dependent oxidoreductase [Streptomyces libani]WAU01283.1 NADP-dependent oxidoreductase [Streptomyces libani subsp. libani]GFE27194.1 NADPH:quinone reductase [Streptomyces libani subsp. libani]GGV96807.1 NADPH:quinone reductase [Streptomyces libani subsp. libani]
MRAIIYDTFGGAEVLRLGDTDKPVPGPGDVRVKVVTVGVNPLDYKRRYGWVEQFYPTTFPAVPGLEFAGVVDALGDGAGDEFAVGDEVFGWTRTGAYAEYALAGDIVRKPAALSFEAAAALPVAGETAQRVLDLLGLTTGETLLLHGAAGAVGQVAVQLAVAGGATVVGTASPANHDFLRALGAVPVAYGAGLADRVRAVAPQGVDAVFDAAGQDALPVSIALRGGTTDRIVTIADMNAAEHGVPFSAGGTPSEQIRAGLAAHARLAVEGRLAVPVVETFPLADAAKAQELSEAGHVRGKLVITV